MQPHIMEYHVKPQDGYFPYVIHDLPMSHPKKRRNRSERSRIHPGLLKALAVLLVLIAIGAVIVFVVIILIPELDDDENNKDSITAKSCGPAPVGTKATVKSNKAEYLYSEQVIYECFAGHETNDPLTITCKSSGKFSKDAPECTLSEMSCGPAPTGVQATVTNDKPEFQYDEQVNYECNEDHQTIYPLTLTCQSDGTYSDEAPVCIYSGSWVMLVLGGYNDDDIKDLVQTFSVKEEGITDLETQYNLPYKVIYSSTVYMGDKIYVIGGEVEMADGSTESVSDRMAVMNVPSRTWTYMDEPRLTKGRKWATAFELEGIIYTVGGYDGTDILSSMECLTSGTWQECGPALPQEAARLQSCIHKDSAWVSGGRKQNTELLTMYKLNTAKTAWDQMASMNSGRYGHGMASDGEYIYVVSGYWTNTIERYDSDLNTWTDVIELTEMIAMTGTVYVPTLQSLIVPGGKVTPDSNECCNTTDTIMLYNPSTNTVSMSDTHLSTAVHSCGVIAVPPP